MRWHFLARWRSRKVRSPPLNVMGLMRLDSALLASATLRCSTSMLRHQVKIASITGLSALAVEVIACWEIDDIEACAVNR